MPFLRSPMGKGVMPDDHPLSVAAARTLALQNADVVFLMGNEVIAANAALDPGITEEQAQRTVDEAVDSSEVMRIGEGAAAVYAYGYRGYPDRLRVGSTEADTVQRIAAQIGTGTPDKPVLHIEIKTDDCRALERAIHAVLEARGKKITGGGAEWFKVTREEILSIYEFVKLP